MFLPTSFIPITLLLFKNSIQTTIRSSSKLSMASSLEIVSKTRVIEEANPLLSQSTEYEKGCYHRISHESKSTKTKMIFGLFLPSSYQNVDSYNTPVIFFLSGLTCDDTNFAMKAGSRAFDAAEKHGIAIIMPDTSPRHDDTVPDINSYDLGVGAGFYVNASQSPYAKHYKMYDYITQELPSILQNDFNIGKDGRKSVCGHSMGGHGALTIALREGKSSWKSVSAFSPICNPVDCPWGKKAFETYLGAVDKGKVHDATCLMEALDSPIYDDILIDQGTSDNFLEEQLKPQALETAAEKVGQKVTLHMRKGFDHSYYFIAKFIEDHVNFHAKYLV